MAGADPALKLPSEAERDAVAALDARLAAYHRLCGGGETEDLHYRVTRDIVVAARRWRKLANDRIRVAGQSMARWETLFLVAFSGEALTQGDLARMIGIEGPTLVRMLDVLAQDGLIERRQSEADRRMTTNSVTPEGRRMIDRIMVITNGLRAEVLAGVDPSELETAIKVLSQIIARLDALE
jgi:MarR family transcriptional regulator for hemolysin